MEADWEMDDSSTSSVGSSIISDASSSSSSSSLKNRQHYRNTHVIGNDRIMSPDVPPPPRDDCSSTNTNSEYEDDDDLSLKDHIKAASRHSNDDGFGEESVNVLRDAESRLNVATPPPPSRSLSSKNSSKDVASQFNDDESNDTDEDRSRNIVDDVSELSDGVASLLRGPIMAAKSIAQIQQQQQQLRQHDNNMDDTPSKVRMSSPKTPSATRREFISSAQKMEPWSPWSMQQQQQPQELGNTPSAARVKFMPSAQKEQPNESDFTNETTTPSTSRRGFIQSAQKSEITQPWSPWSTQQQQQHLQLQESDTPSAARLKFVPSAQKATTNSSTSHCTPSTAPSGFISSAEKAKWSSLSSSSTPSSIASLSKNVQLESMKESPLQDSVSSIGANSPSAYVQTSAQYQNQQQLGGISQEQTTPPNVTFESSPTLSSSSALEIRRKSPVSEEVEAFVQMNKHILDNKEKSLDNIIELGERQMKMGAASRSDNNRNDKEVSKGEPTSIPAKKPFLRKGARKEPSALHKRSHLSSAAVKTSTITEPDATTSESASDRKARLAQLEKMQEDLMKDLERRTMRKEEAQKERRRERSDAIAEKRGTVKSRAVGGSGTTRSAGKSPEQTPTQGSRAQSASGEEIPSRARPKTAIKKPTFMKSAESKMRSPPSDRSNSPTPIVEGKSLQGSVNNKEKKADSETLQKKSAVQVRARSTSRPRSLVQRSNNNKSDEKSSEMLAKAMEDLKKKEEKQMALIKNMRRRQETALREAEGERERAKAWAAAERESVKKWAEEQRVLIRKDRHKAANAALLASRKASREKEEDDANEEESALKAELEEMRLEMKKIQVEADEARKLKEQVRKQERMINALKRGGGDVTTTNATNNKTVGDSGKRRTVLGDRTSNENVQQRSRPKTAGNNAERSANKQSSATKERSNHGPSNSENILVDEEASPQRKPYNAADYASGKGGVQAHSIPQFVSAPTPPGQGGRASQIVTYQNGTTKEVLSDGTTTISFANGDRKRTYCGPKKGIEVYYYAATKVSYDLFSYAIATAIQQADKYIYIIFHSRQLK